MGWNVLKTQRFLLQFTEYIVYCINWMKNELAKSGAAKCDKEFLYGKPESQLF